MADMKLSRRSFLKITTTAGILAAVPIAFNLIGDIPLIIGDGVHYDTVGLQAAMNGKPFACPSGCVTVANNEVHLAGGSYVITDTIEISKSGTTIIGGRFNAEALQKDEPVLLFKNAKNTTIIGNYITTSVGGLGIQTG